MARQVSKNMETIFLICLAALTAVTAQDHERIFSSKFEVLSPPNLVGELDHRGALFGINPVGDTIASQVYYTKRSLCGDETPGTPDVVKEKGYILLVDRGGCSFVEKVRNAQVDNATAVLIADNTCLCSFQDSCDADQECEDSEPTMDDDGTGSDIRIPSMMIFKPDADRLRNELMAGTEVELNLSWPVPKATDGVTQYTLWLTPDDLVSHQFLMSFHEAAIALGDKAVFKPQMFISDGTMKGCRQYDESDPCPGFCTNFGRYCEPRSYYDFDSYDNKGTKMVTESLRRACIWHVYGDDGIGKEWWTYVQSWILKCGSSRYSSTCAESLFAESDIDTSLVEQCMVDSGNFRNDVTNVLLDSFLDEVEDYDVSFAPTLFVNGAVIRGSLTFGTILETICMTYDGNESPEICSQWADCSAQCSSEAVCILQTGQCLEYEVPTFINQDVQYDDDYIDPGWISEAEQQALTVPPAAAPTKPPVPAPTNLPTYTPVAPFRPDSHTPTDAIEPPTDPPVPPKKDPPAPSAPPPTDAPVAAPTYPPVPLPGQTPEVYEDQRVVETIQIFESPNPSNSGFTTGLVAGIGGAVLFGIALIVLGARDRFRQGDMRPLVPSPSFVASDLTMDDGSYYPSEHFRDEEQYSRRSYGDDSRKHPKKKYRSRRAIRRARAERPLDEGSIPRRQWYEDEESVHSRETHSRREEDRYIDEESVVSRHHADGSRRSRNPFEEDNTPRHHNDGSRSSRTPRIPFEEDDTVNTNREREDRSRRSRKAEDDEGVF